MTEICPECGENIRETEALFAVCDALTFKALESIGKWLVREDRSRFKSIGTKPLYLAHTIWQSNDEYISRALRGAWDVIPALMTVYGKDQADSDEVVAMLDSYVHDLAITNTDHTREELSYRFERDLGLRVREDAESQ